MTNRPLRVFLCHSSKDKSAVRELYKKLRAEAWIDPWLDEEKLLPGQQWKIEIPKAVRNADVVIICLSKTSITKEGYVQKEIKDALDIAQKKTDNTIFLIPARLEKCKVPDSLSEWHWVNLFDSSGVDFLFKSLEVRANSLKLKFNVPISPTKNIIAKKKTETKKRTTSKSKQPSIVINGNLSGSNLIVGNGNKVSNLTKNITSEKEEKKSVFEIPLTPLSEMPTAEWVENNKLIFSNGMEFMRVPAGKFLMGSINGGDDEKPKHTVDVPYDYWMARYPVTNEQYNVYVKAKGINHPVSYWQKKKDHPVVNVNWNRVMECCTWLNSLLKVELPSGMIVRLPTEVEWEKTARGTDGRDYPWGDQFDINKCNSSKGRRGGTIPIGFYSPRGDSPYGCADMAGNVWEWTHSEYKAYPYNAKDGREDEQKSVLRVLRGGSFFFESDFARCAFRNRYHPDFRVGFNGFRIVVSPILPS